MSPLFRAYPNLEHFRVRGTNGLILGEIHHAKLKSLVIESGGLDVGVLRDAVTEDLPGLEHLEIWLGSDNYGGNITLSDLEPVLSGKRFPKLKYLGLRDSEFQDEIAAAVARAPILPRLETLDLSLGTLSDEGAAALLGSDAFYGLKKVDLHHHYLSDGMMARLKSSGVAVDLSQQQQAEEEEDRYIAVSE